MPHLQVHERPGSVQSHTYVDGLLCSTKYHLLSINPMRRPVDPAVWAAQWQANQSKYQLLRTGAGCLQVHQHHADGSDPLVYGRTMAGEPDSSEGAAIHKLVEGSEASPVYSVITYP